MGSAMIFLLYSMFLVQCIQSTEGHLKNFDYVGAAKPDWNSHLRSRIDRDEKLVMEEHVIESELNVFFHYKDLKVGNKMQIYFPTKDPSTSPHFLPEQDSESIPFASSQLQSILNLLSFNKESKQALAMEQTLRHCEFPPLKGETKFCATSLESMIDSIRDILGSDSNSKLKVLTTNYLSEPIPVLQNYTVSEHFAAIPARRIVACHTLPYPYAVFYCHSQQSDNKLYKVMLIGENGGKVEAVAMCHMDTSHWDPSHVSFRVLKTVPGASPVCHFFPSDNLVWIPIS